MNDGSKLTAREAYAAQKAAAMGVDADQAPSSSPPAPVKSPAKVKASRKASPRKSKGGKR